MSGFAGFPREFVTFLISLKQNNNKPWFESHRDDYEANVMDPARQFVVLMGERLREISPGVHAIPQVDRSIFRIHRDIRFSKDKSPYKTHIGILFWEGERPKMECSGYYFHVEPPNLMLGVGIHIFPDSIIKPYRDAVVDPVEGPALVSAIQQVALRGAYKFSGKHYKRVPRGYDPGHANAEFLTFNGLTTGLETEIPDEFYSPGILDYCFQRFVDLAPIHRWLSSLSERV
jgi:uncharacterized protein (TIGR02453 family)